MQHPRGVSGLHPGVTAWTRDAILSLPRDEQRALTALVDEAGVRSARAQQLPNAITSVVRPRAPSRLPFVLLVRDARCLTQTRSLRHASTPFIRPPRLTRHPPPLDRSQDRLTHEQRLYLFCDASTSPRGGPSVLLGILKVGCKNLFVTRFDDDRVVEIEPCCVLDFYVHEAAQRGGIGGELFHHFLAAETQVPARLAYDRPSPKLLAFLAKRFHLRAHKPQNNNYAVFRDYWRVGPRPASAAKAAMKEMGGRGGLAAAARAKAAAARAAAAEARRFAGVDVDATRHPSPRFASTTDPSTSRRGSAGPRAPPTPPGIEPARGSRGTDDFTARSSVGFDKPRRVARPARRFADGFADAVDARVGHVSDVRPSNRTSTRGVDTPREDARGGARVPDWKTTAKEATSVDREAASVDVFVRPAPPAAPRFADFGPTRRAPRDLSLTSPKEPFDDSDRRLRSPRRAPPRDSFPSPPIGASRASRSETSLLSPRARRVAGSDETELRKRVDERLREHPHGVDTGTVDASEPGRKYAEFVRRLRAAGASSTDSRCSRRDSDARGEYGRAAYPAPGYYRARAPERPFPEAPVYHYRRSDAPWLPEGAVTRRYDGGVGMWRAPRERWGNPGTTRTGARTGARNPPGTGETISPGIGNARGETIGREGPEGYRRAENEWFTYGEGQDAYWRGRARFDAVRGSRFDPETPRAPMVASAKRRAANAKRFESDVVRYGREVMARSKGAWDAT